MAITINGKPAEKKISRFMREDGTEVIRIPIQGGTPHPKPEIGNELRAIRRSLRVMTRTNEARWIAAGFVIAVILFFAVT